MTARLARNSDRHGTRRRRPWLAATLSVLVAFAPACSDDPNRADDEPRSTTTETTTGVSGSATTLDERRQEVINDLEAAGAAFDEAAGGPDPDYPLEDHYSGPMLAQARNIVQGLADDGLVLIYPEDSKAEQTVLSVEFRSDTVAILKICGVDDGRRVDQDTGEVVVGGGISTVWSDIAMELHGETWKLAERVETERKNGVGSCDSAD